MERNILKENVGIQDQIATAYGGFNHIIINKDDSFNAEPIVLQINLKTLQTEYFIIFYRRSRISSVIAGKQMKAIKSKTQILDEMKATWCLKQ